MIFLLWDQLLHKALFPDEKAKVSLLNIGSEEIKGNNIYEKVLIKNLIPKKINHYEFKGYIEGNQLMNGEVNVIVADGFTGNVALKTAEGTANFITDELKDALSDHILGKISSLLNMVKI